MPFPWSKSWLFCRSHLDTVAQPRPDGGNLKLPENLGCRWLRVARFQALSCAAQAEISEHNIGLERG